MTITRQRIQTVLAILGWQTATLALLMLAGVVFFKPVSPELVEQQPGLSAPLAQSSDQDEPATMMADRVSLKDLFLF